MALIYEIIDTQGKVVPNEWKRLINFSIRNLDSVSLIKNFLSSDNYIYSNSDNLKSKIIEKILDDSNLLDTLSRRKQFWINTRIDRFGKDCFLQKKDSSLLNNPTPNNTSPNMPLFSIKETKKDSSTDNSENDNLITKPVDNGDMPLIEIKDTSVLDNTNIPSFSDTSNTSSSNSISTEDVSSNNNDSDYIPLKSIESNNLVDTINSNIQINKEIPAKYEETKKEEDSINFNGTEFKFDNIIYNGLNDLMNNIDSDISKDTIIKAITGKLNKNFKKKYKEILSKLFIFKDNQWNPII